MDSVWDCSCSPAQPWMLRANTYSSLMMDLSQMRSGPQSDRIWLNPETVKSPSSAWHLPPPPTPRTFLHSISFWHPIFSFHTPACFPGTLALEDTIISSLTLVFKGEEFQQGTQAKTEDKKLLGNIPGAQSGKFNKCPSPQLIGPRPITLLEDQAIEEHWPLHHRLDRSPQWSQVEAVGRWVGWWLGHQKH